jgi:hypothetical protein|tara:strand:- start:278 stop:1153 length:876 start_codon:yes stop_codon:yes gene_type:complete
MAEAMVKEATPKKVAFMTKPKNIEDRIKKDEEELKELLDDKKEEDKKEEEKKVEEKEPDSPEEKTFKKRYGDLRRHTQQKEKDFQSQIDELRKQLSDATKKEMKLPKSDEDIEQWAKDYPDVAAIVETIAMKKASEQAKILEERIKSIDELGATAAKEKAEAELLNIHPDFVDIRESDDFHNWAEVQPKWVQNALYENDTDALSAARAIDLYKNDKNINKEDKPNNTSKEAAKAVKTKSSTSEPQTSDSKSYIKESDVQKMSPEQYEKKADEIMESIRSGKFIYDLSGSAR